MEPPFPRPFIYFSREIAFNQSLCLIPVINKEWQGKQYELWIGIGKKTASCSLQNPRLHKVHQLALVAEHSSKKQLHLDSAIGTLLQLLLEKFYHRLAAKRSLRLFICVPKHYLTRVTLGTRNRQDEKQAKQEPFPFKKGQENEPVVISAPHLSKSSLNLGQPIN